MGAHTPGPWTVEPYTNFDKSIIVLEPRCAVDNDDVDHAEAAANARLIAAAPNLLATVRAIRDAIASCGDQPICAWAGALNNVIARAEGRP